MVCWRTGNRTTDSTPRPKVWVAAGSLAVLFWAGPTSAGLPSPPKDVQIRAPKGLAKVRLPTDLHLEPPPDGWWEQDPPCPKGATLVHDTKNDWNVYWCRDAQGIDHGPRSSIDPKGRLCADGWYEHGRRHGVVRKLNHGHEYSRITYANDIEQGPAVESKSTGDYLKGLRHGRWTVVGQSGIRQHGYYQRGKRQGRWLAEITHRDQDLVVVEATYRNDKVRGKIHWWTERGDLLATIELIRAVNRWQFFARGKPTMAARCRGGALVELVVTRKGKKLTCSYRGDLVRQQGQHRGLGCPSSGSQSSLAELCYENVDLLDPLTIKSRLAAGEIFPYP